jgi:hypothetical protein
MRIVCLSAEAADICFRLGAEADDMGVSAFAPKEPAKPMVSGRGSISKSGPPDDFRNPMDFANHPNGGWR